MRTTTGNVHSPTPTPSYSPSVPLHVYRELVTELQAVQAKLDVVTGHNQKLSQENQQLRQEITKVVQSCLELQKLVDASAAGSQPPQRTPVEPKKTPNSQPSPSPSPSPRIKTEAKSAPKPPVKPAPPPRQPKTSPKKNRYEVISVPVVDMNFPVSEQVLIEEQEVRYYAPQESEAKGLSGWWLIFTILLIMITGFSAGYLVVRPLLQQSQQN